MVAVSDQLTFAAAQSQLLHPFFDGQLFSWWSWDIEVPGVNREWPDVGASVQAMSPILI
jgi:hypothetical protein